MLQRKLTLVEIGGSALPSPSPAVPRYANWFPTPYKAAAVPPVEGVTPNPVADGVLIEWAAVDQEGVIYVIERGPTEQGPWTEIHRTTETRYLYSDGSGQKWWFRITPTVRGKAGAGSTVEATPPTTTADLVEQQEKLAAETLARMRADASETAARAAAMAQAAQDLLAEATLRQQQYTQAMQGIADEARARADAVLNEKLAREAAISLEQQTRQSEVDSLARQVAEVAAGSGTQFDSRAIWYFDQTVEGWTGNGTPTLVDGWLRPANAAATPWVQSPAALAVDGSAYRFVKLRVKRVGSPTWAGFLQWITPTDQNWNTQKRAAIAEPAWDANGVATVDVQDIAWWPGTVDRIRLQLGVAQAVANYYLIDYVAVGRPTPGASVALVQAETVARTNAIAAEAGQRNTLAVQMRGNYTGTDPLQLTAGLAYEELKARVAADNAQVQRISAMEVRMPAGTGNLATSASVTEEALARAAADNATASTITALRTEVDGKASNSALQLLDSKVIQQGGTISSQGNAITGLTSSLSNIGGDNLLIDSSFDNDLIPGNAGSSWTLGGSAGTSNVRSLVAPISPRGKGKSVRCEISWPAGTINRYFEITQIVSNLTEALRYVASVYYRAGGDASNIRIFMQRRQADGALGTAPFGEGALDGVKRRISATDALPVNAANPFTGFRIILRVTFSSSAGSAWVEWDDAQLQQGEVATAWTAGAADTAAALASQAAATTALTTSVSDLRGTVNSQGQALTAVQAAAIAADGKAVSAQQAADAAAVAAGNKGKVIYGATAPAVADRLEQNLWIDTTGGSNTPRRWNGSAWAAVTDKAATDAAAAAAAAQATANAAKSASEANAAATSALTGRVTSAEGSLFAQGQSLLTVNAKLAGMRGVGDNLALNSDFSAGDVSWQLGGAPIPVWGTANGDGKAGYLLSKTGSGNPALVANEGQWLPNRGARRYRAVVRAMGVSGSMNLMMRLERRNRETGVTGNNDKRQTLSGSFATYVFEFDPVDATIGSVRLWAYNFPDPGVIRIDRVELYDVTDQLSSEANAAGLSSVTATVEQHGQQITAQASRIDGVQAGMAGKADASVVQEMRVQVNNQGGGGNLIPNSSFPNWDRTGWGWDWNPSGWQELGDPLPGGGSIPFIPFGVKSALGSRKSGYYNVGAADNVAMQNHSFPLDVAKTYCVSAYVNTHRCRSQLLVECVDLQGKVVGYMGTSINPPRGQSNASLAQYPRDFFIGSPPQGTVRGRLIVQISGNNESDPYFWIVYPMVCEVAAGATKPPPYEPGDQASAQWNLAVQANGISAGMQLGITGQTSALNILANAVNILTPGGADGFEMTQGYLRVWSGNSQRIIGNNFGADGLVDYFGPNVGAVNANKSNATMWMDRSGNAYWGGAIAAGILRNAGQATTTQTIGTSVLVGPFDTNGRNKQVVVGFNRRHTRRKTALGSQGFVAGAGTNGGVINLYRQLDGQAEALWQQIQITGSVDIRNETDGPDIADSVWNASVTLNDNANGTTRRSYRAEIVSFTEQNVTHQSGSFDSQNITQSLSIVSIEQ